MSTPATEATGLAAAAGTWAIDTAHTNLGFSARHAMVAKVRGSFSDFAGTFTIDGSIQMKSYAHTPLPHTHMPPACVVRMCTCMHPRPQPSPACACAPALMTWHLPAPHTGT